MPIVAEAIFFLLQFWFYFANLKTNIYNFERRLAVLEEGLMHQVIELVSIISLPLALIGMVYAIALLRRIESLVKSKK